MLLLSISYCFYYYRKTLGALAQHSSEEGLSRQRECLPDFLAGSRPGLLLGACQNIDASNKNTNTKNYDNNGNNTGNNGYEKTIEVIPLEASTSRELHLDFPGIDPRHGRFSESLRVSCVFGYYVRREQSAIPHEPVRGMAAEARPQMPTGMLLAARNRSCGICRLTHLSEDHGDVATADH